MAWGGSRPGSGRKKGGKNSVHKPNKITKSISLYQEQWDALQSLFPEKSCTMAAQQVVENYIERKNKMTTIMGSFGYKSDFYEFDSLETFEQAVRECLGKAAPQGLHGEDFLKEVGAEWYEIDREKN